MQYGTCVATGTDLYKRFFCDSMCLRKISEMADWGTDSLCFPKLLFSLIGPRLVPALCPPLLPIWETSLLSSWPSHHCSFSLLFHCSCVHCSRAPIRFTSSLIDSSNSPFF